MNNCHQCNKLTPNAFYCSRKCGAIYKGKQQIKPLSTCPCGIKFKSKSRFKGVSTKYHSMKCYGMFHSKDKSVNSNGQWVICSFDGKLVYKQMSHIKVAKKYFCNSDCQYKFTRGDNHHLKGYKYSKEVKDAARNRAVESGRAFKRGMDNPAWKGGVSPENELQRKISQYTIWRDSVFTRDGYTDQKTKVKGGTLVAHHILNFSSHKELRFDVNNGITLSKDSHNEFHKKYGKVNNTKEQLIEFLST